jgi:DNA-binding response OmpR family regulator
LEDAESVFYSIKELWNVPLLLIVNEQNSNWEKLFRLNADGYLNEKIKGLELKARLEATLRRLSSRTNTVHAGHTARNNAGI